MEMSARNALKLIATGFVMLLGCMVCSFTEFIGALVYTVRKDRQALIDVLLMIVMAAIFLPTLVMVAWFIL